MAEAFLAWRESIGATVLATAAADLGENLPLATEWILRKVTGAFHLARTREGLREITVHRLRPPVPESGPITLQLVEGSGLVAPAGVPGRRAGDVDPDGRLRLLVLELSAEVQEDVEAWLEREYEVTRIRDPLQLSSHIRKEPPGGICIMLERSEVDRAVDLCRAARPLTNAAIVVLSRGQLRSSDRARAMEAGADDVLRQDVVLREIQSRFRRAAFMRGNRDWQAEDDRPEPIREVLDADRFAQEVRNRLASPTHGYLTVVVVPESVADRVSGALRSSLRVEAGDFMGRAPGGFGVVLQDARRRHALVYLERALQGLAPGSGAPESGRGGGDPVRDHGLSRTEASDSRGRASRPDEARRGRGGGMYSGFR
jgi:CheY-like chemotaxis protein